MRPAPTDLDAPAYGAPFEELIAATSVFTRTNAIPTSDDDPLIVVDLMMQDPRLALRNLTVVSTLRRLMPLRLVALVGPDPAWETGVWRFYDRTPMTRWATAHGAIEVLDLAALGKSVEEGATTLSVAGQSVSVPTRPSGDEAQINRVIDATIARIFRVPTVADAGADPGVAQLRQRSLAYHRVYDAIFGGTNVAAFVTSHVDYAHWGFGVETATRHGIPVVHVQATGGLKAYALWPESPAVELGFRRALTQQIATHFEQAWQHHEFLRPYVERTVWRSKSNLGRPSWWRGGGEISRLDWIDHAERHALRASTLAHLGLPTDRPVVAVFNHAVSDALWGNEEHFADLRTWFEDTVRYAVEHPEVSWLLVDHPSQAYYDATLHFEGLAERYRDVPHLAFRNSLSLSKNALWSVTDLAVTVRGSVSNEFPAYGVPALQAGWSEWSHCGFSIATDSAADYWQKLGAATTALSEGRELISAEQVERARLWLWLYRSGDDVATPYVPHWETLSGEFLHKSVTLALKQVESDGDPALLAMQRLWLRRAAVLSRFDLSVDAAALAGQLGAPLKSQPLAQPVRSYLATAYDEAVPLGSPHELKSGMDPALRAVEGFVRGGAIVGRMSAAQAILVIDSGQPGQAVEVELTCSIDPTSDEWWTKRVGDGVTPWSGDRTVQIMASGGVPAVGSLAPFPARGAKSVVVQVRGRAEFGRVFTIALESVGELPANCVGMRIDRLVVRAIDPLG